MSQARLIEKAFDRVLREEWWYSMRKSGGAEKYVREVQDMDEDSETVCGYFYFLKKSFLLILFYSLQTIVRGSFIGHGDYISHVISEMTRVSVSSSNSLRRSSPSARKRARSMGRLGELSEDESYQYQELIRHGGSVKNGGNSTYWQDRIQQVCNKSSSPKLNGARQRANSTCQVNFTSEATPLPPETPQRTEEPSGQYAHSEGAELRDRKTPYRYILQAVETSRPQVRLQPGVGRLPDLLSSSRETSRRPHSSYDLQVRLTV